ncbi:hypothetical protein EDC19_0248 [Natranaerovirga hydrolytica]|uniref:Uncharacterized protein n=1 Tax=Natranaerovirga hydrolytica TaxID=680378 RepID=A0A4R1MXB5_9FIRM|nr:hypothetical protein [Natranaerovirga hydrolytica]TCK97846.1 hypothetical protein EDC19_0248 [Natranaerovirga hydrolytica]
MNLNKAKKQLEKGENISESLEIIVDNQKTLYYNYALVNFAFEYIVLGTKIDDYLTNKESEWIILKIKDITERVVLDKNIDESLLKEIDSLRKNISKKLEVLTTYVDELEIYEYIVNRQENNQDFISNEEVFAKEIVSFVFASKDNVTINQKLKEVLEQLPMRLTKAKFFDYIQDSLTLYKGTPEDKLIDLLSILEKIYSPEKNEGYGEEFEDIYALVNKIKSKVSKNMEDQTIAEVKEDFLYVSTVLKENVDRYLDAIKVTNLLYTMMVCFGKNIEPNANAIKIIKEVQEKWHENNEDIIENLINELGQLEGVQEDLNFTIQKNESSIDLAVNDYYAVYKNTLIEKDINNVKTAQSLTSSSFFVDLEESNEPSNVLDDKKIYELVNAFLNQIEIEMKKDDMIIRRAKMSKIIATLPTFFKEAEAIYEYIAFAFNQCRDQREKTASISLIKELMEDYE